MKVELTAATPEGVYALKLLKQLLDAQAAGDQETVQAVTAQMQALLDHNEAEKQRAELAALGEA